MKFKFCYNELTPEEVLNAVKVITRGTYIPEHCSSTLLGYELHYDRNGNLISPDPNRKTGYLHIEGLTYKICTYGYHVDIYREDISKEPEAGYNSTRNFCNEPYATLDFTPDVIKNFKYEHEIVFN